MIRNYLITAIRIMIRQKGYAAINIAGLSMGIATSLLIILYVADELNFDRFHKDANRIYRIGFAAKLQGNDLSSAQSPVPVAEALKSEVPGIESTLRFGIWRNMPMSYKTNHFTESNFLVADSNFFDFFSFPILSGDARTAFAGTNKLVLSASTAKRYFGNEDPVGKIILRGSEKTACEIVAVAADAPANSHLQFDMILSGNSWEMFRINTVWTSINTYTYFKTFPNAEMSVIKSQIDSMTARYIGPELETFTGAPFKEFLQAGNSIGLFLQPLLDIHLKSDLQDEVTPNGNIQYLFIFGAIAAFILIVACINFMNLTTARSASRAKEIGIRKSIGALRSKLVGQFISESMLYSMIATFIALALIGVLLPSFNTLSGKTLELSMLKDSRLLSGILLLTIVIGLIAGSYPAFYLTAFRPAEVLKGKIRSGLKNSALRNSLVVFQFIISIAMILSSLVVYKQLRYMQQKNMGFDKENVIRLQHTSALGNNSKVFKNEIIAHPEFISASFASELPPYISWTNAFRKSGSEQDYLFQVCEVDVDNLETMKYTMSQGRFFNKDFRSDTAAVVINESAFKYLGLTTIENQTITRYGDTPRPMKIIGVVKDFNFESLRNSVKPLVFIPGAEWNSVLAIRMKRGNVQENVEMLERIWKKYSADAFQFTFLDQDFDALFRSEQRLGKIILLFTGLTIFIACLGLFGLATYVSEQRAKEMSIRKVMGASASQIIQLLLKDLTILVMIAFFMAIPLGVYVTNQWLQGFAYHVSIDGLAVLIAGLASLLIAILSISFQSIRAAKENPVKALKGE